MLWKQDISIQFSSFKTRIEERICVLPFFLFANFTQVVIEILIEKNYNSKQVFFTLPTEFKFYREKGENNPPKNQILTAMFLAKTKHKIVI